MPLTAIGHARCRACRSGSGERRTRAGAGRTRCSGIDQASSTCEAKRRNVDEVEGTVAHDLVRDRDVPAPGIASLGLHDEIVPQAGSRGDGATRSARACSRAPRARARCRRQECPRGTPSCASKSSSSAWIAVVVRIRDAGRQRNERVGDRGGEVISTFERRRQFSRIRIVTAHEMRESRCVAADRALRLRGAGVQRPPRVLERALPVARDEPRLHRPDRPSPASGGRIRPALSIALGGPQEPRSPSSSRPAMSSESPAAQAAFPMRVSWRCRSSASSGSRAAPSS